jgi:hypothetical protein
MGLFVCVLFKKPFPRGVFSPAHFNDILGGIIESTLRQIDACRISASS